MTITCPETLADVPRETSGDVRISSATKSDDDWSAGQIELTSKQGFPAKMLPEAHTESPLHRSIIHSPSASMQRSDQFSTQPSRSQEQIMQQAITHQGLERVLLMYSTVSRIVRRIAGSLAITQEAR